MKTKNKLGAAFIAVAVAVLVGVMPGSVGAQTDAGIVAALQAQIQALLQQILTLQAQLAGTAGGSTGVPQSALTLLDPNGGQTYSHGSLMPIQWTPASIGVGTIQLVNEHPVAGGDNIYTIYSRKVYDYPVNYSGRYDYSVPNSITPGSYRVRIFDNRDGDFTSSVHLDMSDAPFTISGSTQPSAGIVAGAQDSQMANILAALQSIINQLPAAFGL